MEMFSQTHDQGQILKQCKFVYIFKRNMPIYNSLSSCPFSVEHCSARLALLESPEKSQNGKAASRANDTRKCFD